MATINTRQREFRRDGHLFICSDGDLDPKPIIQPIDSGDLDSKRIALQDRPAVSKGGRLIKLMHAKLHRVCVTDANVNYEGSVTIDRQLIDWVGIFPLEEVQIWNVSNGNRLSTYVLPGEPGSGVICLNGAAAHLFAPGDFAIIAAYEERDRSEVLRTGHEAKVAIFDEDNRCKDFFLQTLEPQSGQFRYYSSSCSNQG